MREGRFWRVLPADVRLPPLLTTAELMQYHIKSVNGLYQCQDPLIDNSRQHKASERRRLHTQICSAQLLVVISGGETRERRCEFILYTLWITWVFTAWLMEHMCFYMTTVLFHSVYEHQLCRKTVSLSQMSWNLNILLQFLLEASSWCPASVCRSESTYESGLLYFHFLPLKYILEANIEHKHHLCDNN